MTSRVPALGHSCFVRGTPWATPFAGPQGIPPDPILALRKGVTVSDLPHSCAGLLRDAYGDVAKTLTETLPALVTMTRGGMTPIPR